MLSKENKELLVIAYEACVKAFAKLDNEYQNNLSLDAEVSDPFLVFCRAQVGVCTDILASSFNFSMDMEERLLLLSDLLNEKDET